MFRKIIPLFCVVAMMMSFFTGLKPASARGVYDILTSKQGQEEWLNTARPLTSDDLAGRVILVDFWTFCCINCIHVIPKLQALEEEFGHKLTVLGVHSAKFANEKDTANIRNAILRYGIEHPVVNDADFDIWRRFGVSAWPSLFLIGPHGQVVKQYAGEGDLEEMRRDIAQLIKSAGPDLRSDALPLDLEKNKLPASALSFPGKLAYAENLNGGPALVISDSGNNRIVITKPDGTITHTIGGKETGDADGTFTTARFNAPQGVLVDGNKIYVADTENHKLRLIDIDTAQVTTLAGTGERGGILYKRQEPALDTALASPWDLVFYPDRNTIAIAMAGTHQLWTYNVKDKTVSVLAGNGREYIDDGTFPNNSLSQPSGLSVLGDKLYFVDSETSSLRVLEDGEITTLVGTGLFDFGFRDGDRHTALLQHPLGVLATKDGIYITDSYNHALRRYDPTTRRVETLAGNGKTGQGLGSLSATQLSEPNDIIQVGNTFYLADTNNQRILQLDLTAQTAKALTIGGGATTKTSATFTEPQKLPNVELLPLAAINTKGATANLHLPKGWKINADAPSWLTLFVQARDQMSEIVTYETPHLQAKTITLPDLEAHWGYTLQGTFYYCREGESDTSQCLIKSINVEINPDTNAADKAITIDLPAQ